MIARLLSGILAAVFLPLGLTFTIVGLTADHLDRGSPKALLYVGLPFLVAGLGLLVAFVVLRRREAERRRRRRAGLRAHAEIVSVRLRPGVRAGMMVAYDVTLQIPGAGTGRRTILAIPGYELVEGDTIEVLYDPADPTNFEPANSKRAVVA